MTREENVAGLRQLADALEREWATVDESLRLLAGIVATCPWPLDAGGSPEFWLHMRKAERLVAELRRQGFSWPGERPAGS